MGFLTGLTGGEKSSSTSSNQAFNWLKDTYGGEAQTGTKATNAMAALLGLGGDPEAANAAFERYQDSTGFDFMLDQGRRAITGSQAAKGMLQSGSTLKALNTFGQKAGAQYFQNYLSSLGNVAELGQGAGRIIGGAGQTSQSKSSKNDGLFGALGDIGSAVGTFSPRWNAISLHRCADGDGRTIRLPT